MAVTSLLMWLLAATLIGVWLLYVVEGFRQDPGQGLLLLVFPPYVYYFALNRSRRGMPLRLLPHLSSALWLVLAQLR